MADSDFEPEERETRRRDRPPPRQRRFDKEEDFDDDEVARRIRKDLDDGGVSTIIPYKNAMALIAYYLGVFSLIPIAGLLLGPAALVLGILGLRYANKHPTAKGTGHAIAGIVLGLLTTALYWGVLIFLVVAGLASK
jgi:hypothetical protein